MTLPVHPLKALLDRGLSLHRLGQSSEAAEIYRQAIAAGGGALAHDLLAVVSAEAGRLGEADRQLKAALIEAPAFVSSLGHLGNILGRAELPYAAIVWYRRALAVAGRDPLWLRNLGVTLLGVQDASAFTILAQAAAGLPGDGSALNDFGLAAVTRDDGGSARRIFRQALATAPFLPEPAINLALVDLDQGALVSSRRHASRARSLAPMSADALNALAAVDLADERPDDAAASLHRAVALKPGFPEAHYNLGLAAFVRARLAPAGAYLKRTLALRPGYAEAEWNLSLVWLLGGDYVRGWRGYEARWRMRRFPTPPRRWLVPPWQGEELAGRKILLHAEQGLGDTLQFIRYAPLVAERGGRVVLECQARLSRLLAFMPSIEQVIAQGEPPPAVDCHAPLLSLPRLFGTTLETVPHQIPYLVTGKDPSLRPAQPVVGLVWGGSGDHPRDRSRSLPKEVARELARRLIEASVAKIVSLQFGIRAGELADLLPDAVGNADFFDTAKLLSEISLVVGVDTSTIHLAGGLGRPAVLLLSFVPDFRWLLDRTDSPWYPTLEIVRQRGSGDWASVLQPAIDAVCRLVTSS